MAQGSRKVPENLSELRKELSEVFTQVRNGAVDGDHAHDIAAVANVIVKTVTTQLKAAQINKTVVDIDYLK